MKPFRYGDVCEYISDNLHWERHGHIIIEVQQVADDEYEYATSKGAWIPHEDLFLVEKSSKKSRRKLHRYNGEGEEI